MDEKSFVVIEDDESVRQLLVQSLESFGAKDVCGFENGKTAWEALEKNRAACILLDWRLPGLNGLALVNRIRSNNFLAKVPILIISGYIVREDCRLLEEFPMIFTMKKPFSETQLKSKLAGLLNAAKWFAKPIDQLHALVSAGIGDRDGFLRNASKVCADGKYHPYFGLIVARELGVHERWHMARRFLEDYLKRRPGSISLLSELGKVYLHLGQWKLAEQLLSKANQLAPDNIERLTLLGKGKLNELDFPAAKGYFSQALAVDSGFSPAKDGQELTEEIEKIAESSPGQIQSNFASLVNALGVSLVRNGQINKGMSHYQQALDNVVGNDYKARISYNLALGHLRSKDKSGAMAWLERSRQYGGFEKAASLMERLEEEATGKASVQAPPSPQVSLPESEGNQDSPENLEDIVATYDSMADPADSTQFDQDEDQENELDTSSPGSNPFADEFKEAPQASSDFDEFMEEASVEDVQPSLKEDPQSTGGLPEGVVQGSLDMEIGEEFKFELGLPGESDTDEDFSRSAPIDEDTSAAPEKLSMGELIPKLHRAKEIIKILQRQGKMVEPELQELWQVVGSLDPEIGCKAIDQAIDAGDPTARVVNFYLQKNTPVAG